MKKVLLDSSILIDFLRQQNKNKTILAEITESSFAISIITHSELYAGKSVWEKNVAREELEILFSGMEILPMSVEISKKAGEIRAKCGVDLFDAIIAATAIINNLSLLTINKKHFEKIKEIKFFALD